MERKRKSHVQIAEPDLQTEGGAFQLAVPDPGSESWQDQITWV